MDGEIELLPIRNLSYIVGSDDAGLAGRQSAPAIDPNSVTDAQPTLDFDFTSINGAPFKNNLLRSTTGGYRLNSKGVYVATVVNEPVIDFGSDGKPRGTGFYGAYTQLLLNSSTLSTQSVTTTATAYTLSFTGTGSITLSGTATGTLAGTGVNILVSQTFSASAGTLTLTVAGTVTMASLTATAFVVPYVDAAGSTVVRNLDAMSITSTDFTDFFNPVEGTIYVDVVTPYLTSGFPSPFHISDNSYNNRTIIYYDASAQAVYGATIVGGANQTSMSFSANRGTSLRAAYSYIANNFLFSVNGITAASDVSGSLPSGLIKLNIGADHTNANNWSEHIRRLTYFPKALTATQLQRMTA